MKKLLRFLALTLLLTGSLATSSYADGEIPPICDPANPNCKPPAVLAR